MGCEAAEQALREQGVGEGLDLGESWALGGRVIDEVCGGGRVVVVGVVLARGGVESSFRYGEGEAVEVRIGVGVVVGVGRGCCCGERGGGESRCGTGRLHY